jgi:hypothetical protein
MEAQGPNKHAAATLGSNGLGKPGCCILVTIEEFLVSYFNLRVQKGTEGY